MKLAGMGEEALQVRLDEIRRLGELPADVEIVRVLPPPQAQGHHPEWVIPHAPLPPLYLHIRHRYCIRVPPGASLCYGSLPDFLERYAGVKKMEEEGRGKPVPDHLSGSWVEDDA